MHERPGPQYNRGNDPTTGVCILKNATQKKWYLRFWNIFFFILRWRAESPVVFSGVSRGGGGRVRCPLSFRPKRGPKGREKFFFETGPPLYLRIWMTQPHPPPPPNLKVWICHWSYWVGRRNGGSVWIVSNLGRWSLQLELANIPFLKPEKCTPFGRSFGV